jgi:hypothetical protein
MSTNNEKVLQTIINQNQSQISYTSIVGFVLTTFFFAIILVILFSVGNIQEVGQNWSRYRCNPFYMPFAASFGSDPIENFNFCINNIFNVNAKSIFQPLYGILGTFGSIMSDIVNATMGLRIMFSNMLNGFQTFLTNMHGQIRMLMNQVRMSFIKMNNLMGRVFGTMYSIIFMGMSAMSAGQNMANNDLVQFLFEFCFDPETIVPLSNGLHIPISMVSVGDYVLDSDNNPVKVLSKFEFDGSKTPMVAIGSECNPIIMSSKHFINNDYASNHKTARVVSSLDKLICLNVEGHKFKVGIPGDYHLVSDYDESSDSDVVFETQRYAEKVLNNTKKNIVVSDKMKNVLEEYSLGIDPEAFVKMKDGSFKQLKFVKIGDELFESGKVLGKVCEQSEYIVNSSGFVKMSPSQLVWNGMKYIRYGFAFSDCIEKKQTNLIQLFTENCSGFVVKNNLEVGDEIVVREYREIPDPIMENLYAENVMAF